MPFHHLPDFHLFLIFTLVLTRVSGLVMTVPIYGTPEIPAQVRALLAVALALLITPSQAAVAVQDPATLTGYLIVVASELFVGLILGLGVVTLFSGIQVAGQLIGRTSGLTLADVYDPSSGENVPQMAQILFLVTMAVYVTIGGHRIVMAGLLDTFTAMPLGSGLLPLSFEAVVNSIETLLIESFRLGVRAAGPALAALLLSTLVVALIGRTLPQLNIMVLGFGVNSMVTFGVMAVSIGAAVWVFQDELASAVNLLVEAMHVVT